MYSLICRHKSFQLFHCVYSSAIKNDTKFVTKKSIKILGIETSCDDTGCAIVDDEGHILGEALQSQQETHLE